MKKLSIKKISILGVVLLATSAVVAAIVPASKKAANGHLYAGGGVQTNNTNTCTAPGSLAKNCNDTATAGANGTSSNGIASTTAATAGNTTTGDA